MFLSFSYSTSDLRQVFYFQFMIEQFTDRANRIQTSLYDIRFLNSQIIIIVIRFCFYVWIIQQSIPTKINGEPRSGKWIVYQLNVIRIKLCFINWRIFVKLSKHKHDDQRSVTIKLKMSHTNSFLSYKKTIGRGIRQTFF